MHKFFALVLACLLWGVQAKEIKSMPSAPTSGDQAMLLLGENNLPLTEPVRHEIKLDYYECKGLVGDWFLELLQSEMHYFEQQTSLKKISLKTCIVGAASDRNVKQGKYTVYFYDSDAQLNNCIIKKQCANTRNVALVPKNGGVYRSYFLSDRDTYRFHQHCVTPLGKWHANTTCYTIDNSPQDSR
jgi:hypothetical protein